MSTPAGWYPDPADASRTRWWDGSRWTEHTTASPAAAASSAPATPAAPERPRFGEYAPVAEPGSAAPAAPAAPPYAATTPAYPSSGGYPSQEGGYPQGGYPSQGYAAAPAVATGPSAPGANTNTLWIYLCIVASTLPVFSLFFIDWNGYVDALVSMESVSPNSAAGSEAVAAMLQWTGGVLGLSLLSYVFLAASIVFAYLDWRELKKRGVARPFHWAFAFIALALSIGVYIIGRTVVLKRETGSGMAALWVWIGSIVLSILIGVFWFVWFMQQLASSLPLSVTS
ncbi:DUF2510 domain-containing protein [Microbacterium sp. TNHR37B]|uniref:DUF2510 domain-containing protein n=1 Tax=Microbacterium sp. TNHR37B TaxID=1775956 RepID=UPI0007B2D1A4|nr:DUF2510 domain-containing protein [Microbacterium sp. TNHR37B]KZE91754.1 hypothetical protein AVP41_01300 [Microbacterium sp. TNHR37B]